MMLIIYLFAGVGVFAALYWAISWWFLYGQYEATRSKNDCDGGYIISPPQPFTPMLVRVDKQIECDDAASDFHAAMNEHKRGHCNG